MDFEYNESISYTVSCEDQEEVDYYREKLIEGGGSPMDCAWLKDKYEMRWQIVPKQLGELMMDSDREKANKVMQAMWKCKR